MPYWTMTGVITLLMFVDGFDLFLLGKIAPAIAAGFGDEPAAMEQVFTAHQIGLALGAFCVPLLADRFGSRRTLLVATAMLGFWNIASAFAPSLASFALLRGICGLFMSGLMPVALALLSENAPAKRLGTVLAFAMVGMSAGSAANGIAAAWMLDLWGWESGVLMAGVLPLLVVPLIAMFVPESDRFATRHEAANTGLPISRQLASLFTDHRLAITACLWAACFLNMGHIALVAVWLPTYFQELGDIPIQQFARVAMLSVLGGAVGTVAVGWLQDKFGAISITALAHLGNGLGLFLLGLVAFGTIKFSLLFVGWSFFQSASITALNLMLVRSYPIEIRATGMGWAAGIGRIAGTIAPAVGAAILAARMGLSEALALLAIPMVVIGIGIIPLLGWTLQRASKPAADLGNRRAAI